MGNTHDRQQRKIDDSQKRLKRTINENEEQLSILESEKYRYMRAMLRAEKRKDRKAQSVIANSLQKVERRIDKNRDEWKKLNTLYDELSDDATNINLARTITDVTDVLSGVNSELESSDIDSVARNFRKENRKKEKRRGKLDSVFDRINGGDGSMDSDDEDELIANALRTAKTELSVGDDIEYASDDDNNIYEDRTAVSII